MLLNAGSTLARSCLLAAARHRKQAPPASLAVLARRLVPDQQQKAGRLLAAPFSTSSSSSPPSSPLLPCVASSSSFAGESAPERGLLDPRTTARFFSTANGGGDDKSGAEPQEETTTTTAAEAAAQAPAASEEEGGDEEGAKTTEAEEEEEEEEEEDVDPDQKKIEELEGQVAELKNQVLRSLADQENTRRIASLDSERARQLAIKGFAKSLLEVWDNLSRALEAAKQGADSSDNSSGGSGNADSAGIYQGIEMTQSILRKAFESNGLRPYGDAGDAFDPQVHNALSQYKDPSKTPGTVGQVVKAGFRLHDHVLRPADVMVIAKED